MQQRCNTYASIIACARSRLRSGGAPAKCSMGRTRASSARGARQLLLLLYAAPRHTLLRGGERKYCRTRSSQRRSREEASIPTAIWNPEAK